MAYLLNQDKTIEKIQNYLRDAGLESGVAMTGAHYIVTTILAEVILNTPTLNFPSPQMREYDRSIPVPISLGLSVTQEAHKLVRGERREEYGPVTESFEKIAKLASQLIGKQLSTIDICWIMMALKMCREKNKHKRDNLVDLCGYADLLNELLETSTKTSEPPQCPK